MSSRVIRNGESPYAGTPAARQKRPSVAPGICNGKTPASGRARIIASDRLRKKSLSVAAARNGEFALAREVIDEVVANDKLGDHSGAYLDLARLALDAGDETSARELLDAATPGPVSAPDDEARLCMECMAAVLEGEPGIARFDRVRPEIARRRTFAVKVAIDVVRAALHFSDVQLANVIAERTLAGTEAREAFSELLAVYRQRGLESQFRELQKEIVERRLGRGRAHD